MVAAWEREHPRFVLGAMLPDFAGMCRTRLVEATDPDVQAGIEMHHRVDAVFHDLPTFRRLMAEARQELRHSGVPRPATLAASHVGVEMLLDGVFVQRPGVLASFDEAMHVASDAAASLRWASDNGPTRFEMLRARVIESHLARQYARAQDVADRLVAMLQHRPRLDPGREGEVALRRFVLRNHPSIAEHVPALLAELEAGLAAR